MHKCLIACIALLSCLSCQNLFAQRKDNPLDRFISPFNAKQPGPLKSPSSNARGGTKELTILVKQGRVQKDLKSASLSKSELDANLAQFLELSEAHQLVRVNERTDNEGFTHTHYQQHYRGVPVDGEIISIHSKNGVAEYVNGQVVDDLQLEVRATLTREDAHALAMNHLNVTRLLNDYPVELVVARVPSELETAHRLAYKVRIDGADKPVMYHVYVDATTGEVFNKISLIAHADALGTANTLYSGTQSITHDSFAGGFRLRESGRKIETYNATNATGLTPAGYSGVSDFISASSSWGTASQLLSINVTSISQNWWFSALTDNSPDLYVKIKDGSNQIIYQSAHIPDTNPPVSFTGIDIQLNNPPYTLEVWDYDAGSADDLGGTYPIPTAAGTPAWSGNGNNGTFNISSENNPALDVHWGMEQAYDFYLNTLGRNSFDNAGSLIKQYVNPPSLQARYGQSPNNAFARSSPYNIMEYGLGDGVAVRPMVGLDIEGHEFTHLVVGNNGTGGLNYQGESGALNESFSDILGTAVEFFAKGGSANWTIGEDVTIQSPYARSLSNPNSGSPAQPDTYLGTYWMTSTCTPSEANDQCGVHTNSGVQNYWFYLLSQGGSGTNDKGNAYNVTGIGLAQAIQIAYRNLVSYMTPNATYLDAYEGSLRAAEDLYGNPSTQYTAVRAAWYAVGIGNDPFNYCTGITQLTASSGTITDGSGNADYNNSTMCTWVIAPPGANQVALTFTTFNTEATFDVVTVYDGPNDSGPILATWWGNTLPPIINSTVGALCIKFTSDANVTESGWAASYTSTGTTPTCNGGNVLATPTGTVTDGSGAGNYGNNQLCYWLIAPPCATSVTLTVSQLSTEANYDGIIVYNGPTVSSPQLGAFSGTTLPAPVTATSGQMLVVFVSDYSTVLQGFSASYTSTGSATCSGTSTVNTADYGLVSDGSGANNYCNNLDCSWLIQPPDATKVTLNFTAFDLEAPSSDGNSIYDAVEVYDGSTMAAPLLGRFSGSNLPPAVTSTGGSLLIRFYSDPGEAKQGWSGYFTSQTTTYCTGPTTLTMPSGTFNDGSGGSSYGNNTQCSWLIKPPNAKDITLSFTSFDTELNADGIIVYDGETNAAPVLGVLSGNALPSAITSTGGSMFLEFVSDESDRRGGWNATYSTTLIVGLEEITIDKDLRFYPNPASGSFVVESQHTSNVELEILDVLGRPAHLQTILRGENRIDIKELTPGVYVLAFQVGGRKEVKRLVIQ